MLLAQTQQQKQVLSVAMQQSLKILQLPALSLGEYLSEVAMENPMVEVEENFSELSLNEVLPNDSDARRWEEHFSGEAFERPYSRRKAETTDEMPVFADTRGETLAEHLINQLKCDRRLPEMYLPMCCFLVESLNSRGYLDDSLEYLANSMSVSLEDALQALYVVQGLSPIGVGARSLEECLILQLAQSRHFNSYTLKIVNECLSLLAKNNITAIAKKLGLSKQEARKYCDVVRNLNPIPSRGFSDADTDHYTVPEAIIEYANGKFVVQYNRRAVPRIHINQEYEKMLRDSEGEVREYLSQNRSKAQKIMQDIDNRETTLTRVIQYVISAQEEYLLDKRSVPVPLTIKEVSKELALHPSTVSRAVKDKYITLNGKPILLKSLFAFSVGNEETLSKKMVMEQLRELINAEDSMHPLTDEALAGVLKAKGVNVSRRTVAAYRVELGIPTASGRNARNR